MASQGGLLTKRALVLAKVEAQNGIDPLPTAVDDAILVSSPTFTTDPQVLERDFVSNDLSKFEHIIGRVVAGFSFVCDLRGNGKANTGVLADAPKLATLFRGCGYEMTAMDGSGATNQSQVVPNKKNAAQTNVVWNAGGTVTLDEPVLYTIEVVTPGASGVAEVLVTSNNPDADVLSGAAVILTNAASLPLGAKGGELIPTITGTVVAGDKWQVQAWPTGIKLEPRSDNYESLTIYSYHDGKLHKGHAGMGTFTIEATAGDFGRVSFNFTTTFVDPTDTPMPTAPNYETTIPPQIELSLLSWGGNKDLFAESWSYDAANDIQARMDVNARQGYRGSRISDRAPAGGFTPEAQLEADQPFWKDYLSGTAKTFTVRAGTEAGNMVCLFAPNAQTSELSYSDRNGLLVHDKSVMFKRGINGNDEITFVFC